MIALTIPLKNCDQCSHYRGNYCYGFGTAKKVFSKSEALLCGTYTPLGQVQIGPLDSLGGQLVAYQIPAGIISTLKLADLAVTIAKLGLSSVIDSKVAAGAGIVESKLNLIYGTQALHDDIQTRVTAAEAVAAVQAVAQLLMSGSVFIPLGERFALNYGDGGNTYITAPTSEYISWFVQNNEILRFYNTGLYVYRDLRVGGAGNDNTLDIGGTGLRFKDCYLGGSLKDDVYSLTIAQIASQLHARYSDAEALAAVEAKTPLEPVRVKVTPPSGGNAFEVEADDLDVNIWETLRAGAKEWGYYLKYVGLGSGDANYLELWSHNGVDADVLLMRWHQTTQEIEIPGALICGSTVDGVDVSVQKTEVDGHLVLGSENAEWINCPLESWNVLAAFRIGGFSRVYNEGDTNGEVYYSVPLPTNRGGKKLHISGTRVSLAQADANNFVSRTDIVGQTDTAASYLDSDHTDKDTIDCHEDVSMGAVDCSGQHTVKTKLECVVATGSQLAIQFMTVRYYYA